MKTRESRKVRRYRRAAAFHADRARLATTPHEQYRAVEYQLVSAAAHANRARVARELRDQIAEQVKAALDKAGLGPNSRELYLAKLHQGGAEVRRLGAALMCLRGVIGHLPAHERDRMYAHYTTHFQSEASRIEQEGGGW